MSEQLTVLNSGSCERLKAGVHGTALGLAIVMGLYNAAAWLRRRESHLAINAVFYAALTAWEQHHFAHHLARLQPATSPEEVIPETKPKRTRAAA